MAIAPTEPHTEPSSFRAYIDEVGALPADVLLGRIVLFTIADAAVKRDDVKQWFHDLQLDPSLVPAPNKTTDAFKKATSSINEQYPMARGREGSLMARDVTSTGDYLRRQITREIRDPKRKVLDYDEVITCTFYRPTSGDQSSATLRTVINPEHLEPGESELVGHVANLINARYHHFYAHLDSQKVRACVREYVKKLGAIEIKGGVYFVHASRDDELQRLAKFVGLCGDGCYMQTIPIVDLESEREFLTRVFEREAAESLQSITDEARALIAAGGSVTGAAFAKIMARYDQVMNHAQEHMFNLQITQDITAAHAEVAVATLQQLKTKMLED